MIKIKVTLFQFSDNNHNKEIFTLTSKDYNISKLQNSYRIYLQGYFFVFFYPVLTMLM